MPRSLVPAAVLLALNLVSASASAGPPPVNPAEMDEADPAMSVPVPTPQCKKQQVSARYRITLKQGAELPELVDWMMSVSCQKFIWDPSIRAGKVNIVSPEPVSLSEAYAAFYAALQTMGLTVAPAGDYYKIVELENTGAASLDLPVYGPGAKVPADDRFATQVVRPPPGQQADVVALLEALKTKQGSVRVVADSVLVTDTGHRIRRMLELVDEIETPPETRRRVFLYGIKHAEPESLAEVVRSVFDQHSPGPAPRSAPKPRSPKRKGQAADVTRAAPSASSASTATLPAAIHLDVRTGTLVVVSTADQYAPIRRLVDELDLPDPGGRGTLHVIELRHADAAEVKEVLTGLAPTGDKGSPRTAPVAEVGAAVGGDIEVMAHVATQTLVIRATASDFAAVYNVVQAIDRPQRQLYIELYLLEVRADNFKDIGVGAHGTTTTADGNVGIVSSAPGGTTALNLASQQGASSLVGGLTAAFIGPAVAGYDIPSFGVTLQALETREDVNVIARPHMYAAENQEALVEFGDVIPMNGGTTTLPGTVGGTSFNVNREQVGMTITVVPKVNDDETITMDVALEDTQLGPIETELNSYRTSKRRLDLKKIIAHPGQPVVLGGLVKDSDKISEGRVPGLGSLPVLGWLFKRRKRDKEKVTLLMVMVPHIIDSPDDARRIHAQRLEERMDFIQQYTAFKRKDLDTHINYRKKAGLFASVNSAARRQAAEANRLDDARRELAQPRVDTHFDLHAP